LPLVVISAVGFAPPLDAAPLVPLVPPLLNACPPQVAAPPLVVAPPLIACPPQVAAPPIVAVPLSDPFSVRSICMVGLDAVV
jgi:hypothetical protein